MRDYNGDFEVHVTVRSVDDAILHRFQEWCHDRQVKCLRIVLSRGKFHQQPMATWHRYGSTLPKVHQEAERCAIELDRSAIPIARVKIEASPNNEGIPVDDADALGHDAANYFEHHVKLLRAKCSPRDYLLQTCDRHGAHLSRNAFRVVDRDKEEQFVTFRSYRTGRINSERRLQELLIALTELGEKILEHETEYCVYDSNLSLDAGWLSPS
jgi:hypothetical protein